MLINYDNRTFKSIDNSSGGDVGSDTTFNYRQTGESVWATYQGGNVKMGTLIARVLPDDSLDMRYQHITIAGEFRTGRCHSTPSVLEDGRIRLTERWVWNEGGVGDGHSVIEELT